MGVFRGLVGAFESAYVPVVAAFIVAHFQRRDVGRIYGVCLYTLTNWAYGFSTILVHCQYQK